MCLCVCVCVGLYCTHLNENKLYYMIFLLFVMEIILKWNKKKERKKLNKETNFDVV